MKLIRPLSKTSQDEKAASPRSAQVRERRVNASQARVQTAARQAAAANPVARRSVPVTPGFRAQPVMQRTASKARRKFSIALGADGAQLVLPALPMIRPGWQTLSAILAVAFLAAILYMTSSDTFRVEAITVNGAQRVQTADLMASLNISGDPAFSLDARQLTEKLREDFPEFSSVNLSIALPNQVTVDVVERQPVFEWIYQAPGSQTPITFWIDLDGAVFLPRGVATAAVTVLADVPPPMINVQGAPINTGEVTPTPSAAQSLQQALAASAPTPLGSYDPDERRADMDVLMAAARLIVLKADGASLKYSGYEGFGWQDPRGWDVYFGTDLDDLELKFEMYQAIIGQLAQQGIQPYLISVAHLHAPFYRALETGDVEQ